MQYQGLESSINRRYLDYLTDNKDKTAVEEQNLAVLTYAWRNQRLPLPKQAASELISLRHREIQLLQEFTSLEAVIALSASIAEYYEALAQKDKNAEYFLLGFLEILAYLSPLHNHIRNMPGGKRFCKKMRDDFPKVLTRSYQAGNFTAQFFYMKQFCTHLDRFTEREFGWIREGVRRLHPFMLHISSLLELNDVNNKAPYIHPRICKITMACNSLMLDALDRGWSHGLLQWDASKTFQISYRFPQISLIDFSLFARGKMSRHTPLCLLPYEWCKCF